MTKFSVATKGNNRDAELSLIRLLDPDVLADPYPLFHQLRREDPVHWDPFLHCWVVTRYWDVIRVLRDFSAQCTPSSEHLTTIGLSALNPVAKVMVRQMLFLDPPAHTRIRSLAAAAFTPQRVEVLRSHIRDVVRTLLAKVKPNGRMDVIADLAEPLPSIVTAEMLGLPVADHRQLKLWSQDFAEVLGNFQHNPDRVSKLLKTTEEMTAYFRSAMRKENLRPDSLVSSLMNAEIAGDRLTEDEVIANSIITMVGGQETTPNLIGNGVLALLHNPDQLEKLRANLSLIPSAVEELLRFVSPVQMAQARYVIRDLEFHGQSLRRGDYIVALLGAANADPARFPDAAKLDLSRSPNPHVSFGSGIHFCLGAQLARAEAQVGFERLFTRYPRLALAVADSELRYTGNTAFRALVALPVRLR